MIMQRFSLNSWHLDQSGKFELQATEIDSDTYKTEWDLWLELRQGYPILIVREIRVYTRKQKRSNWKLEGTWQNGPRLSGYLKNQLKGVVAGLIYQSLQFTNLESWEKERMMKAGSSDLPIV